MDDRPMKPREIDLNGPWQLQFGRQVQAARQMAQPEIPDGWTTLDAIVPGNVELDLIRAGQLPVDLDRGDNIYLLRGLEANQWWYRRQFELSAEHLSGTKWQLVLAGIDTLAAIWLNGAKLGVVENMLIPHRLDVTGVLRTGANEIVVGIDSPVLAARETPVAAGEWALENNWESLTIRKAAHGFGWDIMPRAVSAGLWRPVWLESQPETRFRDVYLATTAVNAARGSARLLVRWDAATPEWPLDDWSVCLAVSDPAGGVTRFEHQVPVICVHGLIECDVAGVEYWWPRGYGAQKLYEVCLELRDGQGRTRAEWTSRFGFRTVELRRTDLAGPEGEFAFVVNGERVFAKGTNWVPLDAFHSRDADRLAETLALVVDLNCNIVRCWGGNVYESERFFAECDAHGIMVWQDFALACALYPQTAEFHARIRAEAEAIIPLLRNHPSLVLWAGNNEIDAFYEFAKPTCDPNEDDEISRRVLATACRRLDPWRPYLPSSPYYSPALWKLGAPLDRRPEDHLWGPRDDFKGRFYGSSRCHFVSEIGYHGCPAVSSLERMMSPGRLWPWPGNDDWLTHAVRPMRRGAIHNGRIKLMADQIGVLFRAAPDRLEDFVFASQFSQAEAVKHFIELFRTAQGRRSGIIWWNVRDGWPQISDAVVDYYGARKIAYEVIRRVQTDVCVMVAEPERGAHRIVAVNDTRREVRLEAEIRTSRGVVFQGRGVIPPNGWTVLGTVAASPAPDFYRIEWRDGASAGRNHYLAGPRPFDLNTCRDWYRAAGLAG